MRKTLLSFAILISSAVFASGDLDLSFGMKGHVYFNETNGKEIYSWKMTERYYGDLILSASKISRGSQTLHSFMISENGDRIGSFGKNGYAELPMDGVNFPEIHGNEVYLNKINYNRDGFSLFLKSYEQNKYSYLAFIDTQGKPVKRTIYLSSDVRDLHFFSDETYLAVGKENNEVSISAHQKDGSALASFGVGGYITLKSPYHASKIDVLPGDKLQLTTYGYPNLRGPSNGIKLFQMDLKGMPYLPYGTMGSEEYTFDPVEAVRITKVDPNGKTLVYTTLPGCRGCRDRQDLRIWRFDSVGYIDSDFGKNGYVFLEPFVGRTEYVRDMQVDKSSRVILLVESYDGDNQLLRLTEKGDLDKDFGYEGRLNLSPWAEGVQVDSRGRYVVHGSTKDGTWVDRYLP